jgi:SAM-dependent methyltransferase
VTADWDAAYTAHTPPPWDIGHPQPAFARLAARALLAGPLLDAGCGTGEHTLLAAAAGADPLGVDISAQAIEQARRKAAQRRLAARFEVMDALDLGALRLTFATVIDSGLFHVFDDRDRARYVASLGDVLAPAGTLYLMCFSDRQPGDFGPRRVRADELRAAFADGWIVDSIVPETFELSPGFASMAAQAWLATIRRG